MDVEAEKYVRPNEVLRLLCRFDYALSSAGSEQKKKLAEAGKVRGLNKEERRRFAKLQVGLEEEGCSVGRPVPLGCHTVPRRNANKRARAQKRWPPSRKPRLAVVDFAVHLGGVG